MWLAHLGSLETVGMPTNSLSSVSRRRKSLLSAWLLLDFSCSKLFKHSPTALCCGAAAPPWQWPDSTTTPTSPMCTAPELHPPQAILISQRFLGSVRCVERSISRRHSAAQQDIDESTSRSTVLVRGCQIRTKPLALPASSRPSPHGSSTVTSTSTAGPFPATESTARLPRSTVAQSQTRILPFASPENISPFLVPSAKARTAPPCGNAALCCCLPQKMTMPSPPPEAKVPDFGSCARQCTKPMWPAPEPWRGSSSVW
mmetsp:Transcript_44643/g.112192  ORF Transcript_44643/g.112192 Transcript_44643/m.112192 type:complete len:258 (+) Transcript_44643:409-1182(+)